MKKLLIAIGLIIVLFVVALVAIPLFIDPNDYKDSIVEQVKKHTGRDLIIKGDLKMSKFPALGVDIGEIELGNAPGFGDQPMLKSGRASVSVKLLPLLKKDLQVSTLTLRDVYIYLARDKSGKTNWDDLLALGGEKQEKQDTDTSKLAALAIGGIDLENANLVWDDQQQGKKYLIKSLNLKTGKLQLSEPIDLEMACQFEATSEGIIGDLNLDGTIEYDLDNKRYSVKPIELEAHLKGQDVPGGSADIRLVAKAAGVDMNAATAHVEGLDLDALGTKVSGDLMATHIFDKIPLASGRVKIDAQSIPDLLKALGQDPDKIPLKDLTADADFESAKESMTFKKLMAEATLQGGIFKQPEEIELNLSGKVNIANQTLDLSQLSFAGLDTRIKGKLSASHLQAKIPLVDGDLKITADNVTKLLLAAGQDPEKIPLQKFDADLKVDTTGDTMKIEKLDATAVVHGGQFKDPVDVKLNVRGDVNLDKEAANLTQLSFEGLGATVKGNLKASKILSPIPLLDGKLEIKVADVPSLLAALGQDAALPLKSLIAKTNLSSTADSMKVKNLTAKATLAGDQIPNSPVDVTLDTTAEVNLANETLKVQRFAIKGMGLDVQGAVSGAQIIKNPNLSGNLKIIPFNLRQMMEQLKLELPATADPKVLTRFGLNTKFNATKNSISLKGLAMKLDDSNITGDLAVVNFSNPAPTFNIKIDAINADRYLPPKKEGQETAQASQEGETGSKAVATEGLPMDTLRKLKAKGVLNIGSLIISNAKLKNVRMGLDAKGGKITLKPAKANLYQGSYNGTLQLDATGKVPAFDIASALSGVKVGPLLKDLTGKSRIDGTLIGNVNVTAMGADANAIKRTLNGTTDLKFTDGALIGVNLARIIREAKAKLTGQTVQKSTEPEKTDFSELSASTVIKNGLVSNDDFLMKSPFLRVTGNGKANLVTEKVDYHVKVAIVGTYKGQGGEDLQELKGITIPIKISGTFSDLSYTPDMGGVLKARAEQELKKQEEKLKQKAAEKLEKALPGKLKGLGGLLGGSKDEAGGEATAPAGDQAAPKQESAPAEEPKKPEDVVKDKLKNMLKF